MKGWRAVQRVTVEAVWNLTRAVATRALIPGGGGLIVLVGFSPLRGIPGFAHASAGRAAVANLASGLALEWSRHGIRTVCVAPGTILTEALIAFLASDGGTYITGTTIVVDGGADAWGLAETPPAHET